MAVLQQLLVGQNHSTTSPVFVSVNRTNTTTSRSTNGTTWTTATAPFIPCQVVFGNGVFMITPLTSSSAGNSATSTDGITWTTGGSLPAVTGSNGWQLACAGTTWVAFCGGISSSTASRAMYVSTNNGVTWTVVASPPPIIGGLFAYDNLTAAGGIFYYTGGIDISTTVFYYSTNGTTWTAGAFNDSVYWVTVVANSPTSPTHWIAMGNSGSGGTVPTNISTNGTTWTSGGTTSSSTWGGSDNGFNVVPNVNYGSGNNAFVAFQWSSGSIGEVYSTNNGSTWTVSTSVPSTTASYSGVAYSPSLGTYVLCGNGTNSYTNTAGGVGSTAWTAHTGVFATAPTSMVSNGA